MRKNNEFGKIISFYIPSIISFVIGLTSAFILTRVFNTETYGLINIFNNTAGLILSISYFGLDSAYIRFYNDTPQSMSNKQMGFCLMEISLSIYFVFAFIIVVFWVGPFSEYIFGFKSLVIVILLIINVLAQIILRYFLITYRMTFNTRMYAFCTIAQQLCTKFFVICAAIFTSNVIVVLGFNAIGIVIVVLSILFIHGDDIIPQSFIKLKLFLKQKDVLKFALFAAPTPVIVSLNSFIAQRVIISNLGNSSVGIYSSASFFTSVLLVLQSGFATYWAAYVYKNYKTKQPVITMVHDYLMIIVILIYGLLILFRDFLYLLVGAEFHESKFFFPLVIFYPLMTLLCESTGYGINIMQKNYLSVIVQLIAMLTNCGLASVLIKKYGLTGVALASAISGIVYFLLISFFGQKYYKTISSYIRFGLGYLILIFTMIISIALSNFILRNVLILLLILAVLLYRKSLYQILKMIMGSLVYVGKDK